MSNRSSLVLVLGAALSLTMATSDGFAQKAPAKTEKPKSSTAKTAAGEAVPEGGLPHYIRPETPEQRRDRIGSNEDPGTNPDENKIYFRYGKKYKIFKVEKEF